MASIQRVSLLAGSVAAGLVVAFPAHAEEVLTPPAEMAEATEPMKTSIEFDATAETVEATGLDMTSHRFGASGSGLVLEDLEFSGDFSESIAEVEAPATQPVNLATLDNSALTVEESVSTSSEAFFTEAEIAQTQPAPADGQEVAQVTRPLYRGVAPFYVGVGGNIGIIDSDESAIGDFGFNIISKISLGPRFSVRPSIGFSEDDFNVAIPLTYNFNPVEVRDIAIYPSAGAGVDIGDEIGLLINGGIDIPVSRDFTLNGQVNWRATSDVGLGVSLGIGYNFAFFFE